MSAIAWNAVHDEDGITVRDQWNAHPVLDNIAAAAHACNIHPASWVSDCFSSPEDAQRFLLYLGKFKGHLNSYWFYALLSILEIDEQDVYTAELLARQLTLHAVESGQIDSKGLMCQTSNSVVEAGTQALCLDFHGVENNLIEGADLERATNTCVGAKPDEFAWVRAWLD